MQRDPQKLRDWQQRSALKAQERRKTKAAGKPMRRTKLVAVSPKRRKIMPARKDCRETVLRRSGGRCEARLPEVCSGAAEQVHELLARSQGGSITDPNNCLVCCAACHSWVTRHMNQARALRLAK